MAAHEHQTQDVPESGSVLWKQDVSSLASLHEDDDEKEEAEEDDDPSSTSSLLLLLLLPADDERRRVVEATVKSK